jgi:sarcosine oxidase subunit beta
MPAVPAPRYVDSPPPTADLVVIGGGVLGAATAFYAARRGLSCVLLEKHRRLCTLTTPAATGAFRAQFDNPEETRLVQESIAAFASFPDHLGLAAADAEIRFQPQGYLWLTTTDDGAARQRALVERQRGWGLDDVELLSGDEARRRFPYLAPEVVGARFRAGDGFLEPRRLTMAFATASAAALCLDTPATGFDLAGDRVIGVRTPRGAIACQHVVVAAGPFSGVVAGWAGLTLDLALRIRQKLVMPRVPEVPAHAPMTIDEDTGAHWRPALDGAYLLHTDHATPAGPPLWDVPTSSRFYFDLLDPASPTAVARAAPFWRDVWSRNHDLWFSMAGQYVYTPDHRPLLGPTAVPGLSLNTGYSGHGVMGSAGGSRLAVDALLGLVPPAANPFRPDRPMLPRPFDVL